MPTVIELSGAAYPVFHAKHRIQPMEGLSLVPSFQNDRDADRVLLWEHYGKAAIRRGKYKLVRAGFRSRWELYDIDRDRSELHDLSSTHPERVNELRTLWESHAWRTRIYPTPDDGKRDH
jgi:arylsulfatase